MSDISEQFFTQVSESIKSVFNLTSRIDERVKMIHEKQQEMDKKFSRLIESLGTLNSRVSVLESTSETEEIQDLEKTVHNMELILKEVELKSAGNTGKWAVAADFGIKILWALVAAAAIYYMGFK
jgi:predicted nuclease with TOPRIM domain